MKPIDPTLLEQLLERVSVDVVLAATSGLPPTEVAERAEMIKHHSWFRQVVVATIDRYRHVVQPEVKAPSGPPMTLTDLEWMRPGAEVLEWLRANRGMWQSDGLHLVWVVPTNVLKGVTNAYGLRVVRTDGVGQPCLAIQWAARRLFTDSDKGAGQGE